MLRSHILRQAGAEELGDEPTGISFIGYEESIANTNSGNPQTFSGVSFGTQATNREVVVVLCWRTNANSGGSMSVTIGGESATSLVFRRSGAPLFSACVEIFKAAPSGGAGDIVVTNADREVDWLGVGVYAAYGYIGGVPDTDSGSSATLNLTSSEANTSIIAGAAGNAGGNAFSLGGSVSPDADVRVDQSGDDDQYGFGSASALAAGNYTVTESGSQTYESQAAIALITYVPPPPISFIGGIDEEFTTSGTQVYSLPTSQQNDILVLIGGHTGTGTSAFGTAVASGWTSLDNGTNSNHSFIAAYKIMGATPDTQIDVGDFATSGDANGSFKLAVFRGVDTSTPMDATYQKLTLGNVNMNPPAITTVTDDAVVVTGGYIDGENVQGPPTGYTTVGDNNVGAGMAFKQIPNNGSEDPGDFSIGDQEASVVYTIALRPST